jgi:hypothetical protein
MTITADNLVKTTVRGAEFSIIDFLDTCRIYLSCVKIIRSAEIIFCPGTANRREFSITINEKFDFAFSPPAVIIYSPGQLNTDILTFTPDTINNSVV